jgi:uncharacterized protein (DUF169 family)
MEVIMERNRLATQLSSRLGLDKPPVALAFVSSPPPDVEPWTGQVPSACTFWRRAETRVFYAPAEAHFNCPVGAMVMGFQLPEPVQGQLMGLVQMMGGCGYLAPEEAAKIPVVAKQSSGIVYGPLHDFPTAPDLILMWLTPRQAMLCAEAGGACRWTEEAATSVFGRPGCSALPLALGQHRPATSFGCTGMRTFTEIEDDRFLLALPGAGAEEFARLLETSFTANQAMQDFYSQHKASLAG